MLIDALPSSPIVQGLAAGTATQAGNGLAQTRQLPRISQAPASGLKSLQVMIAEMNVSDSNLLDADKHVPGDTDFATDMAVNAVEAAMRAEAAAAMQPNSIPQPVLQLLAG
jgi:hypothetical protein